MARFKEYSQSRFDPTRVSSMSVKLYLPNCNLAICGLSDTNGCVIRTIDIPLENAEKLSAALIFFLVLSDDFRIQRKRRNSEKWDKWGKWRSIHDILIE